MTDDGFANIGVRPTDDDKGLGGTDPAGNSLSITRNTPGETPDAIDGTFKVPGLRNVDLTAPYFHNGSQMTLRQVVEFYNRGGDFANTELSPDLQPLGLSEAEKDDLVTFLEALTDPRVKDQSAPFDHPELYVPVGEKTNTDGSVMTSGGQAVDCFRQVPATGTAGGAPLVRFPDFSGPPCDDAPDVHNPPAVPRQVGDPGGRRGPGRRAGRARRVGRGVGRPQPREVRRAQAPRPHGGQGEAHAGRVAVQARARPQDQAREGPARDLEPAPERRGAAPRGDARRGARPHEQQALIARRSAAGGVSPPAEA